jgi:hypothetical protein
MSGGYPASPISSFAYAGDTMARSHYYLSIADLAKARGSDPQFSFAGAGPDDFAAALQQALREADLFNRWRAAQPDPDAVDDSDLHIDVELLTALPMSVVRQRLNLLIGSAWQLRDMRSA